MMHNAPGNGVDGLVQNHNGDFPSLRPRLIAVVSAFLIAFLLPGAPVQGQARDTVAPTPPMGWNSWDSYGLTVRDAEVRANADWMAANLKQNGWQYIVVDEGWYVQNPESAGKPDQRFTLDANGLYQPAPNRFPSAENSQGLKALADYVHSLCLKFGIHIIRGISREAVARNLAIAGSAFHASEAADQNDKCYWQGAG